MDVASAVRTKRAIRAFDDRSLAEADLERILDAGRRAWSSKNLQRWDFIVCRGREHLQALAAVGRDAGHLAGAAVAIALVTPDPRGPDAPLSIIFDLGQAAANMSLVAWELEIGSVPATVYDQELVSRLLKLPPDRHCEYLLSLGYPADPALLRAPSRPGGRKLLSTIVHDEVW
ncbi:MAG: nitroreductase family protein [Chloroflexota bacterium]